MEKDSSGQWTPWDKVFRTGDGKPTTPVDDGSQAKHPSTSTAEFGSLCDVVHTAQQNSDPSPAAPTDGVSIGTRPSSRLAHTSGQASSQSGHSYLLGDGPNQFLDKGKNDCTRNATLLLSSPHEAEGKTAKERKDGPRFKTLNSSNGEAKVGPRNANSSGRDQQGIASPLDAVGDALEGCPASIAIAPEEQIGRLVNSTPASKTAGVRGDLELTRRKLCSETLDTSPPLELEVSDVSKSSSVHQEEKTPLLRTESDPSPKSPDTSNCCSKAFFQSGLRYRSKCRKYKFIMVSACYASLIVLVITIRNLRAQPRDMEEAGHSDLILDELELRLRRDAEIALGATDVSNETKCPPKFDRDHNEIRIMSYDAFMNGGWIVHVLIGMYTFAAIAAICDIYFVPALEHICEDLKLEADVAGATFMAAASSAPEFCTSVIGIFVQESDVGLGAIVGSSIFNLLAIVGLCAIFSGGPVELSWYPLTRDSIFYSIAIFEMLAFMYDSVVHWYEALVMIVTYLVYILVMVYNKRIERFVKNPDSGLPVGVSTHEIQRTQSARLEIIRARSHSRSSSHNMQMSMSRLKQQASSTNGLVGALSSGGSVASRYASKQPSAQDVSMAPDKNAGKSDIESSSADPRKTAHLEEEPQEVLHSSLADLPTIEEESEGTAVAEYENPLEFPEGCISRMYWIMVLPVTVIHAFTIPDSRIQNSWQSRFYMIPFALSVVYLAVYSYFMVWAMSVAAWGLNIPDTVTGLTILAAGTSVPDCLSSIFVARDGFGDMAVSNAIGSNVFDILLCLGVPWMVTAILEVGHPISSEGMFVAGSTLVVTIVYLILSLRICNWTLTPPYGFLTLIVYVLVIGFCICVELNIIFNLESKKC